MPALKHHQPARPAMSHRHGLRTELVRKELLDRGSVLVFASNEHDEDILGRSMVFGAARHCDPPIIVSSWRLNAATLLVYDIARIREAKERRAAFLAA